MTERRHYFDHSTRRLRLWGMTLIAVLLAASIAAPVRPAAQRGQAPQTPQTPQAAGDLSGAWTLDREASQFPREIGFDADFVGLPRADSGATGGGRGRRGGSGSGSGSGGSASGGGSQLALRPRGESYDDAQRRVHLTDEVRTPPTRLTIVETADLVTFSDDAGLMRSVHPDSRAETIAIAGASVLIIAHREEGKLIVLYSVADLRQIRYTYSRPEGQASLAVDVEFIERNKPGDTVRRIYNPLVPSTPTAASAAPGTSAPGTVPAAAGTPRTVVPRAGSEFAGLKRVGIVVEELSTQAVGCGLKREALEAAAAKPFSDAGLRPSVNSDEDTYVHVTLMTSVLSTGMCITRYDWSLYSMTDATLSYQHTPLLAQVLLAHKGGLSGSMPAAHAADVIRGVTNGLTEVAGLIRDANK